jgi:hypothetical protein
VQLPFIAAVAIATCADALDPPADVACVVDADCVLMPDELACCGACDPTPPFQAVTRGELAARREELAATCRAEQRACEPLVCPAPRSGCVATAVCVEHRCDVRQHGCHLLVSD